MMRSGAGRVTIFDDFLFINFANLVTLGSQTSTGWKLDGNDKYGQLQPALNQNDY